MTIQSIKGAPRKFDQLELEQRQSSYSDMYKNTMECKEVLRAELPHLFLQAVIEKHDQGYVLDGKLPIKMEPLNYQAYFIKPLEQQAADIEVMLVKVKEDYIADLEREREEYKVKLTAQLLKSAELKEQKKEEEKKAKLLKEIQAEVDATFAPLSIPE